LIGDTLLGDNSHSLEMQRWLISLSRSVYSVRFVVICHPRCDG